MDPEPRPHDFGAKRKKQPSPPVKPPFEVATWKSGGLNLRAFFSAGKPQWIYERVHKQLQSKREGGAFLKDNLDTLKGFFADFGVPSAELGYKHASFQPTPLQPWHDHTVSSRGLVGVLLFQVSLRQVAVAAKQAAIALLHKLAAQLTGISGKPLGLCLEDDDGVHIRGDLTFSLQGVTQDWYHFLSHNSAAVCIWEKLQSQAWCGHLVTSGGNASTIQDILLFFCYLVAHQKEEAFDSACKVMLPDVLVWLGLLMDEQAAVLAKEPLEELPLLKTLAGGHKRKADKANAFILMDKMKDQKASRKRIASTHDTLVPKHGEIVEREAHVTVALYNEKVAKTFAPTQCPRQFSVAWDPSDYSGRNTLVSTVYSPELGCAAYMPNQMIRKLLLTDLHESFLEEAKASKLGTLEGYSEIRALSFALQQATGNSLLDFRIPENLLARPLRDGEARVCHNGIWYIVGPGDLVRPEVPPDLDLSTIPALVSCSDQGPSNTSSLNFIQFAGEDLMVQVQYDCFHRSWNDLKLSAKRSAGYPWRSMLQWVVLFNINYSPFGSGQFFYKKQDALQNYMVQHSFRDPKFQAAIPGICRERHLREPESPQEEEELFNSLAHMNNMLRKGPLIKLLRWMSFFEVALEWKGDIIATKLILEADREDPSADTSDLKERLQKQLQGGDGAEGQDKRDAKKELDNLKRAAGVWKLAPQIVTPHNLATLDMLLLTCKATWKCHAERARNMVSPAQVLEHNLSCCKAQFWSWELEAMVSSSLWDKSELVHMYPKDQCNEKLLHQHMDFFHHLLSARATSLAAAHTLPPMRWNGVLLPDPMEASAHRDNLLEEWDIVLRLEAASLHSGRNKILALEKMYWRLSTYVRVLALAHERDSAQNISCQAGSAFALQRLVAKGLGDSRVVEVAHQSGPDIQRTNRHNATSQVNVMFGTIKSGALEQRKVSLVKVDSEDVIFSSGKRLVNVKNSFNPGSHKLDAGLQRMMRRRQGANFWHSPAPASLFPSLACTEWVLHYLKNGDPAASCLDDAWLSCVAGRCGDLLAHKPTGQGL